MTFMTDEELERLLEAIRQENKVAHEETRRHFDTIAEGLHSRIQLTTESVGTLDAKLEREIGRLEEKVGTGFAETQAMIKFSHAELDRRVRTLEQTQSRLERAVGDLQERVERLESTPH